VLLTDRNLKPLPRDFSRWTRPEEPAIDGSVQFPGRLRREVRRLRGRWLLIQEPAVPWRVWHFRLPRWMYERLARHPSPEDSGGWNLYFHDPAALTLD